MPSRAWQIVAFLAVLAVSVSLHRFIYLNLKRMLLRDYPKTGARIAHWAKVLFITMDAPFVFLYFRSAMSEFLAGITTAVLYPFAIWQFTMLMWAVILVPVVLWRRTKTLTFFRKKDEDNDIDFEGQLEVVTE